MLTTILNTIEESCFLLHIELALKQVVIKVLQRTIHEKKIFSRFNVGSLGLP